MQFCRKESKKINEKVAVLEAKYEASVKDFEIPVHGFFSFWSWRHFKLKDDSFGEKIHKQLPDVRAYNLELEMFNFFQNVT